MRRRRKTKYTWLPIAPQAVNEAGDQWVTIRTISLQNDAGSPATNGVVTPVLNDVPQADDTTGLQVSMVDAIGSEYFLKRIVGKCFVSITGQVGSNGLTITRNGLGIEDVPTFAVTAGFYVAPEEHPAGSVVPMGFAADSDRYNSQTLDAIREPWIWRRTWLLCPVGLTDVDEPYRFESQSTPGLHTISIPANEVIGIGGRPASNDRYGSIQDGPHIDAKTARRVRQHERLWFTCFSVPIPIGQPAGGILGNTNWDHFTTNIALDCRYLGALRKARNRSSFE